MMRESTSRPRPVGAEQEEGAAFAGQNRWTAPVEHAPELVFVAEAEEAQRLDLALVREEFRRMVCMFSSML
jgi:hypothetical protein